MGRIKSIKPLVATLPPRVSRPEKYVDPFYRSRDWTTFATAIKIERRWRCDGCGKDCSENHSELIADHIKERKDGGKDFALSNVRLLCLPCHNRKTAKARTARYTRKG